MSNAREVPRTERLAIEAIWGRDETPGHLDVLDTLLQGEPTTAELEEAQTTARLLLVSVSSWVSARHLIEAAPRCSCDVLAERMSA